MTRGKDPDAPLKEARIQAAIEGIKSGLYNSAYHASQELKITCSVLYARLNGTRPRNKAHEEQQILTQAEEKELLTWITQLTRQNYGPRHAMVVLMAEHIRRRRVRQINDQYIERVHYDKIGDQWVSRFMGRHPQLQTIIPRLIEAGRVKDTSVEALMNYFDSIAEAIEEYNILEENVYNMDESGFSIGTIEASKVIINREIREYYQSQPGRQEWVTSIECICADGSSVPPLLIFKAENFSPQWVPDHTPHTWRCGNNSKGWTSNEHGIKCLRECFEPATREKANGQWRMLISDGHDSHITGDWLSHCLDNKILPAILPPHSSHLTQPLDIGIFGPLKKVMSAKITPLIMTGVRRIHKVEWFSAFVHAHNNVFNYSNIKNSFVGAGLFPFQPSKVLGRVAPPPPPTPPPPPSPSPQLTTPITPFTNAVLTSSPVDMNAVRKANTALVDFWQLTPHFRQTLEITLIA